MAGTGNHCSFVLLAEFHILEGAQLKYQFPQPLGVDESVLAMSMLPDGAEAQLDDWTVFFLNQTPFNTISPVLALDSPEIKSTTLPGADSDSRISKPDLLCVLNLVRTKHDKTFDRGARVLAMAICTRHPFIQIFKPVLLMALDDYLLNPSQDCLARLFDAVNAMDLSGAPILSRHEKMVMRLSERKDIFSEKFMQQKHTRPASWNAAGQHRSNVSVESNFTFDELRNKNDDRTIGRSAGTAEQWDAVARTTRDRADTDSSVASSSTSPPSDSSFTLGGSAVWVGDESGLDLVNATSGVDMGDANSVTSASGTMVGSGRPRRSTDGSSGSSHLIPKIPNSKASAYEAQFRSGLTKDTHFFHTTVGYKEYKLPIKMPLSTFPEEVGDYSLITLVKVFSSPQLVSGPQHPHLHTSGPQTHPIIILFNALVTGKRVIFLGHRRPAGEVSTFVLAACALGSGCGAVLRGFVERAFPYANLNNREEWESVPAYIAGVTNPIFGTSSRTWDVMLDIGNGTVTVSKDIHAAHPVAATGLLAPLISRTGTLKAEANGGNDDEVRGKESNKDFLKTDNVMDNVFIEDVKSSIEYHYGESVVRVRFMEYVTRFVRIASRYEEEILGTTSIGYPNTSYVEGTSTRAPQLGGGTVFTDDQTGYKELSANAHRIEAWRKTNSYHYFVDDFVKSQSTNPVRGFDVLHQLLRLRHAKHMTDSETYLIMKTLEENVRTYEQVVELLSYLMPLSGGLLPLGFGLFHPQESIRDITTELFNHLRQYPVGVISLQTLNHFQRYAYVRLASIRDKQQQQQQQPGYQQQQQQQHPQSAMFSRTHSNSSASMSISGIHLLERANGAF